MANKITKMKSDIPDFNKLTQGQAGLARLIIALENIEPIIIKADLYGKGEEINCNIHNTLQMIKNAYEKDLKHG